MDTRTYQQILQARRAEWEALHRTGRRRRAEAARARSAARWVDDAARPGQEVRAARLRLVPGLPPGAAPGEPGQQPAGSGPALQAGRRPGGHPALGAPPAPPRSDGPPAPPAVS